MRYKSKSGKKINIIILSGQPTGINEVMFFNALDADNRNEAIFIITFKISRLVRVQLRDQIELDSLLINFGLSMTRGKIDKGNLENSEIEITYDVVDGLSRKGGIVDSQEEIFELRYRIKRDILACVYAKTVKGVIAKDLMDYVWCDHDLLLEELFHLDQEGLISNPRFTKEELDGTVVNKGKEVLMTTKGKKEYEEIMKSGILEMNFHLESFRNLVPFASNKTVFLAYRFNEMALRDKIASELDKVGFDIKEGKLEDLEYISEDILNKIKESGFFLALLTPSKEFKNGLYSTSSWILMEIGAAIAFGRKVLILAEDCIDKDEYAGKLQRDCEYITFNRSNFDDRLTNAIARIAKEWSKQESLESQSVTRRPIPESRTSEKETKQKIAEIQINRIIEDATPWLEDEIKQTKEETNRIANLFNKHGAVTGGEHIGKQIDRTNNFIRSTNEYIKEINRKIEDILLGVGEEKLDSVAWLKDEHRKCTDFIERTKKVKDSIKQQNNELCLRFTDKPTFENILKAHPYTE